MTVYENLAFGLKLRKLPKGKIKEQISDILTLLGLPDVAKNFLISFLAANNNGLQLVAPCYWIHLFYY